MLIWALVMAYIVYRYMKKTGLIGQENSGKDQRPGQQMNSGANTRSYPKPNIESREYPRPAAANQKTDILSRAQKNAKKYEADETLRELETDHAHREKSKRTIEKAKLQQQKDMHPHDAAHVSEAIGAESASILPTIEDLMVKGYEPKLSFERDFVGEGIDMISRFTVPDTIQSAGAFADSKR